MRFVGTRMDGASGEVMDSIREVKWMGENVSERGRGERERREREEGEWREKEESEERGVRKGHREREGKR